MGKEEENNDRAKSERDNLIRRLGRAIGITGRPLSEEMQNLIKDDPDKLKAFLQGYEKGEEERDSDKYSGKGGKKK